MLSCTVSWADQVAAALLTKCAVRAHKETPTTKLVVMQSIQSLIDEEDEDAGDGEDPGLWGGEEEEDDDEAVGEEGEEGSVGGEREGIFIN